jgi:predicted dehydrogenase
MLRAASIGLGWWSDELAKAIHGRTDKIAIAGCYSRSPEKRSGFAGRYGARVFESYESVLADRSIDAVLLTTPHSQHGGHICAAAKSGKHVFVEKPLDVSVEAAKAAIDACRRHGVVLAVGHNRRFSAVARELQRLVQGGAFGTLLHAEANFSAPGALGYTPERWRAQRQESPGGAIAALGIHMIDLMTSLLGSVLLVRAIARRRAVPVDIEDTTSALFEFASGATGYLGTLFACPKVNFINVYGTAANAYGKVDDNRLELERANAGLESLPIVPMDTLHAELEAFAEACAGRAVYPVAPESALHNVAVMTAMVASAAEAGAPVKPEA